MVQSSKKSFWCGLCSEQNTFLCTAGMRRVQSRIFLHELNFFTETFKLFYWSKALKIRFDAAYVVSITRFCALRAPGAREAGFFFHGSIFFAETVPTRYRMSMGGVAKWVLFRTHARTHAGRQTRRRDITKIYILILYKSVICALYISINLDFFFRPSFNM